MWIFGWVELVDNCPHIHMTLIDKLIGTTTLYEFFVFFILCFANQEHLLSEVVIIGLRGMFSMGEW